jgi:hypothetical protein
LQSLYNLEKTYIDTQNLFYLVILTHSQASTHSPTTSLLILLYSTISDHVNLLQCTYSQTYHVKILDSFGQSKSDIHHAHLYLIWCYLHIFYITLYISQILNATSSQPNLINAKTIILVKSPAH